VQAFPGFFLKEQEQKRNRGNYPTIRPPKKRPVQQQAILLLVAGRGKTEGCHECVRNTHLSRAFLGAITLSGACKNREYAPDYRPAGLVREERPGLILQLTMLFYFGYTTILTPVFSLIILKKYIS